MSGENELSHGGGFLSEPLLANNDDSGNNLTSPLLLQDDDGDMTTSQQEGISSSSNGPHQVDESSVEFPSYTVVTCTNPREYYDILLMCIFTMTFIMLVLGSYFFEWSDTVLNVQVDTLVATNNGSNSYEERSVERGQTISFNLPLHTDATFQTTLSIFKSSHSNTIVLLIILSAIVAPLVFTILQPIFILIITSYKAPSEIEIAQTLSYKLRSVVNAIFSQRRIGQILTIMSFLMKFSMSMIFVNSILNICTSKVEFILGGDFAPTSTSEVGGNISSGATSNLTSFLSEAMNEDQTRDGNSINAQVVSNARGGLISYMVGFSIFGIGALILIQSYLESKLYHLKQEDEVRSHVDDDDVASGLNSNDGGTSILSPPPNAFQHHTEYTLDSHQYVLSKDESFPNDTGLGTSVGFSDEHSSEHMTPLLSSENQEELEQETVYIDQDNKEEKKRPIVEIIMYECGLLSFILLIPITILPLLQINFSGMLRPLLSQDTLENTSFTLLNVANALVAANSFGRDLFGLLSILSFWINVVIIPSFTWVCCTILWFTLFFSKKPHPRFASRLLSIVKKVHPFSFMTPFAMSLFVTVSSLQQVSDFLFNQNDSCAIVQGLLLSRVDESSTKCLLIKGHVLTGSYMLLLHGIFLDVFVGLAMMNVLE